jgi:polar amino acid transport system substrate-binding protein
MRFIHYRKFWFTVLAGLVIQPAAAICTRTLQVPISPVGISVTVRGNAVSGIYPDILREVGAKLSCQFNFSPVPRARQEALFEVGESDILVPAVHSSVRDKHGYFVPMVQTRAMLLSVDETGAPITNFTALLERKDLRVAVVRGFDYGPAYFALLDKLTAQGRLLQDSTPANVARLLKDGMADVAIMPPSTMAATLLGDPRIEMLMDKLRAEALDELEWNDAGLYLSRRTLPADVRRALEAELASAPRSRAVFDRFRLQLPAHLIKVSMRPKN